MSTRLPAPSGAERRHPARKADPDFRIGDFTFQCRWVGDNGGHYEWRSTCGRLTVAHAYADRALWPAGPREEREAWAASMTARKYYWACVDGLRTQDRSATLVAAMGAAITALAAKRFGPAPDGEDRRSTAQNGRAA